jgi:hypothetical protein
MDMITRIELFARTVPAPMGCNDGFHWFSGPEIDLFDVDDFAAAFHLNVSDIDMETIKTVQDAVNNNYGGSRYVEVTFEKTEQ